MFRELMNKLARIDEDIDIGLPARLIRPETEDEIIDRLGTLMDFVDGWENISSAADTVAEGPPVITYVPDFGIAYMIDGSHHLGEDDGPISVTAEDGATIHLEYLSDLDGLTTSNSFFEDVASNADKRNRFNNFIFEPVDVYGRPLSKKGF